MFLISNAIFVEANLISLTKIFDFAVKCRIMIKNTKTKVATFSFTSRFSQKLILLCGLVFLFSNADFAQAKADFSGTWTFDRIIFQPDEKVQTETVKMLISQTPNEIKIQRGSEDAVAYPFGSETTVEVTGATGKILLRVKAELANKGKLYLNSQQIIKTNGGDISVKIKEIFELSADGNVLNVSREIQNSKGLSVVEALVAKKQSEQNSSNKIDGGVYNVLDLKNQFSQGVLNGKAKHFQISSYPSRVAMGRMTGVVPVRVIFDEAGKVIFAQAFSNYPLFINAAAMEAAMKATFEPVEFNGKIIKVSGTILYHFNP